MQQSIFNNNGFWISADSNINMYAGIVGELLKKTDWEFDVLIGFPFADINNPNEILKDKRIKYIRNKYPVDAILSRYYFDVDDFKMILVESKPEVIWNNISEITRNIKAVCKNLKLEIPIINCNYWIDAPWIDEGKVDYLVSYVFRQIDGALTADLVPFTCENVREAFFMNMETSLDSGFIDMIKSKSTIWNFGFSKTEMLKYWTSNKFNKKTILFPNRLSGINYTHHLEFIEVVNKLYEYRQDFQVVFTNPSQKIDWQFLKDKVKALYIVKESSLNRKEYIELLWMSDIVVNLYDIERYGGCANIEAIFCDCLPVMTKYGEYIKRTPKNYKYFIDLPITIDKIFKVLYRALDNKETFNFNIEESAYETVSELVIQDINKLIDKG